MELKKPIYFFVLSISLLCLVNVIFQGLHLMSGALWTLLSLVFMASFVFFSRKVLTDFSFENKYFRFMFWLYFVYQLIIIARGLTIDYNEFKMLLQTDYIFWPYVIPIFVLFDKKLSSFVYLLNVIFGLAVFFLIASVLKPSLIITRITGEDFIHPFAFGCGLLLLNARYISRQKSFTAFFALLVGLLSFIFLARRNGVVSYGALIVASIFLNIKSLSASRFFKFIPIFSAIIIAGLFGLSHLPPSLSSRLTDRMTEDSRSDVFDNLSKGMQDYMVLGKGMNGMYYSPSGGELADEGISFVTVEYRNVIENGYLQLFLNGGIVEIVLFVLILLPAVILGFFKSKNQLVQAFSIIIFLWMVDMAIFGLPRFTLEYILVWIGVGVCYKKSLREKTNEEINEAFNNTEIEEE